MARIAMLRRQRWTEAQIAHETGVSTTTMSRVLRRLGLNRLKCSSRPPASTPAILRSRGMESGLSAFLCRAAGIVAPLVRALT